MLIGFLNLQLQYVHVLDEFYDLISKVESVKRGKMLRDELYKFAVPQLDALCVNFVPLSVHAGEVLFPSLVASFIYSSLLHGETLKQTLNRYVANHVLNEDISDSNNWMERISLYLKEHNHLYLKVPQDYFKCFKFRYLC